MLKKLLAGVVLIALLLALTAGAFVYWLRSDAIRQTLAAQATEALGVPVRIENARATLFPRLGIELLNLTVGDPVRANVERLAVATGFSVVWTRRVEDAELQLTGGSIDPLLLAALAGGAASGPSGAAAPSEPADAGAAIEIASIESIRLRDITVLAGTERVPLNLDASLVGDRLILANATAKVADATLTIEGEMSSLARREGHFDVRADALPVAALLGVLQGLTPPAAGDTSQAAAPPTPFKVTATIAAPSATLGDRRLEALDARLEATPNGVVVEPLAFGVAQGRVEARVAVDAGDPQGTVSLRGRASNLDLVALQAEAGTSSGVTGSLGATFDLGVVPAADPAALLAAARGTIDLDARDGRMPGIQVVRQAVIQFANRAVPPPQTAATDAYSRVQATVALQNGTARVNRLTMNAADFDVDGTGAIALRNWDVALEGEVALTEALSEQAGRDLYRYARDGKRIVLPVIVGGTLFAPTATIDVGKATGRALRNRAEDEARSLFDRFIRKRP